MLKCKFIFGLVIFVCCVFAQTPPVSPVDLRIAAAQKQIKADPKSAAAFNAMAIALVRKGRDYQDEALYREADKAIDESLKLSPDNYDALKTRVAVLLGLNEPAAALKVETELNKKTPDDISGWALLVDANVALGNYGEAERAAQWILDLRPGSSLGFEKAAHLRELFGDAEGAIEFLDEANRRTSQNDTDQKAWLLTQKAHLILGSGNAKGAADLLTEAMRLFPDSQRAAAEMANVDVSLGKYPDALTLLEQRYRKVPSAGNLYDWADGLARAGETEQADAQFKNFEAQARADKHHTADLDLVAYYADRAKDPAKALSLAKETAASRQDSATLAAYAWALYRNGQFPDANVQMEKALTVGVRDPVYFCHAAMIAGATKDSSAAERYSKELSTMPGSSCPGASLVQSAREVKP